jgi:hypothetical protein
MNGKMVNMLKYTQSKVYPCLYYHGKSLFVYVNNGIFRGPDAQEINILKQQMSEVFKRNDKGDLSYYIGVNALTTRKMDPLR